MQLTDKQTADAVTNVLEHFGKLINATQGTQDNGRKTVGVITVQFHNDGQYSYAFGGYFQKAAAMGALLDTLLNLRESIHAQQTGQEIEAFVEMLTRDANDVN